MIGTDGRITLHDVTVRYGRRLAVEAVSGEFAPGSLTAVVGPNGAGKSTLLAAIAGTARLSGDAVERPPKQRPGLSAAACGAQHRFSGHGGGALRVDEQTEFHGSSSKHFNRIDRRVETGRSQAAARR